MEPSRELEPRVPWDFDAIVLEIRGPYFSTLNSWILIKRRRNEVPIIFGDSHIP